jgi:hypothetical protein
VGLIPALEAMLAAPDGLPAQNYARLSPDGAEHWPVVVAKGRRLAHEEPTFSLDDVSGISTPTLVLAAAARSSTALRSSGRADWQRIGWTIAHRRPPGPSTKFRDFESVLCLTRHAAEYFLGEFDSTF